MANNDDFNYRPLVVTTRYSYPGSSTPPSVDQQVVAERRRIFQRWDPIRRVPIDGFRDPTPWKMHFVDLARYLKIYRYGYLHFGSTRVVVEGGMPHPSISFPSPDFSRTLAMAELKAYEKLKDAKVSLGVSFGERKEAAGMMVDRLGKVASAFRRFKKGDFRGAGKSLGLGWKSYPNNWLEYQYGWKPLLGDIHAAASEINRRDIERPTRCNYFVKATSEDNILDEMEYDDGFSVFRYVTKTNHKALARFDFTPNPDLGHLATLDQWGILNPLEVAWELLPFSFVVDWAIPVGDYLSALTAALPYNFVGGSSTRWTQQKRTITARPSPYKPWYVSQLDIVAQGEEEKRLMDRYVHPTFPTPDPRAFLAQRNSSTATISTRVANAISLIASAFR